MILGHLIIPRKARDSKTRQGESLWDRGVFLKMEFTGVVLVNKSQVFK